MPCGRAEYVRMILPDDPMEGHVDRLAREVAAECPSMAAGDLARCFEHVFELSRECVMFDRFCAAYQAERSIIGGDAPCHERT